MKNKTCRTSQIIDNQPVKADLFSDALNKTNWLSGSYKSLVHIRFNYSQTFPNSGNAINNGKKVLWDISEGIFVENKWNRNYGRSTDWKAVLGSKNSIWINNKYIVA